MKFRRPGLAGGLREPCQRVIRGLTGAAAEVALGCQLRRSCRQPRARRFACAVCKAASPHAGKSSARRKGVTAAKHAAKLDLPQRRKGTGQKIPKRFHHSASNGRAERATLGN